MEILQRIQETLTGGVDSTTTYRCEECGETHASAKSPDRAMCPECLSREVVPVENDA